MAFGSGGTLGTGLGQGNSDLILFAANSDFILATVGEELGLAGMMAFLLLYGLIVERGVRTALAARDPFGKLLAIGLSGAFAIQVFVVVGRRHGPHPADRYDDAVPRGRWFVGHRQLGPDRHPHPDQRHRPPPGARPRPRPTPR